MGIRIRTQDKNIFLKPNFMHTIKWERKTAANKIHGIKTK